MIDRPESWCNNSQKLLRLASQDTGMVNTRATSMLATRKAYGHGMTPTIGLTRKLVTVIIELRRPRTFTSSGCNPISSCASLSAVCSGVVSPSSHAPPGKETCPLCDSTLSVRRVKSRCHSFSWKISGTKTAAHRNRVLGKRVISASSATLGFSALRNFCMIKSSERSIFYLSEWRWKSWRHLQRTMYDAVLVSTPVGPDFSTLNSWNIGLRANGAAAIRAFRSGLIQPLGFIRSECSATVWTMGWQNGLFWRRNLFG